MLDRFVRPLIDPPLHLLARVAIAAGLRANTVTVLGFVVGMAGVPLVGIGAFEWALVPLLLSRVLDGLDGAIARLRGPTDFGGYLDIVCDFIFYAAFAFAFALADPANALWAGLLLVSFMGTGSSFLAWAILAAKRGLESQAQGRKSFFYSAGLIEGSETIAFLVVCCLLPQYFRELAIGFSALCALTVAGRIVAARADFGP